MREVRATYIENQGTLDTRKLVFLDETAAWCHMPVLYGWSKSGEQAVMIGTRHGKRLSMVGAIALDGDRGHMAYEGTLNTDLMVKYIHDHLGPNLRCGDVVVMDGASVHKTVRVREAIASFGANVLILPPYSPELNPIEHAWSTVKAYVRKVGASNISDLRAVVKEAWSMVTDFTTGWIRHCGYALSR